MAKGIQSSELQKNSELSRKWAWVVSRVFDPVIEIPLLIASVIFMALANGLRFRFLIFDVYQRGFAGVIYALGFGDEADFRLGYDPPGRTGGLYFLPFLPSFWCRFCFLVGQGAVGEDSLFFGPWRWFLR